VNGQEIINPDTIKIFSALDNKARFVGGCVRNILLKIGINDVDIATEHKPEDTIKKLVQAGIKAIPTGISHGTITALLNGKSYEITTLRQDINCDGRHAQVKFTDSWEEDAARRDFTFNAMSMDLDGKIYDYFGGQQDLQKGVVKFVGNANLRVNEDVLRVLRFFRFFAFYGKLPLDKDAINACISGADKIPSLSGERIQNEMFKLLDAENPAQVITIMQENNINNYLFERDVNIKALEKIQDASDVILLRLAALMTGFSIAEVNSQAKKWKLSNRDKNYLLDVFFPHTNFDLKSNVAMQHKAIRWLGKKIYKDVVLLKWSLGGVKDSIKNKLIYEADSWKIPTFPVNGNDIQNIGIAQGKHIGEVLFKAEKWWENNNYKPLKAEILDYILAGRDKL
jgi:poly(A) polymerase